MPAHILIHHDPVFGLHAHTTPEQTAAITNAFDEILFDINIPAAKRLRHDTLDLVIFRYESMQAFFEDTEDIDLHFQSAPLATDTPPDFPHAPHLARLVALGEPEYPDEKLPPDYYQRHGITPTDTPALMRLYQDHEIIHMENHGAYHTACWARFHILRASGELRAPGTTQLMLDKLRTATTADDDDADDDNHDAELIIADCHDLLPKLGDEACATVIAELNARETRGHYDEFANNLAGILGAFGKLHPHLRDTCRDILCKQLENHPVNDDTYNGFLVSALIDLKATEAVPLLEQTHLADTVDTSICGDWEDVQRSLGLKEKRPLPNRRPPSLRASVDDDVDDHFDADTPEPIRNTSPKIGRNDPCPCGSGKKHKKCCIDKPV
jgi:hypothetical protein